MAFGVPSIPPLRGQPKPAIDKKPLLLKGSPTAAKSETSKVQVQAKLNSESTKDKKSTRRKTDKRGNGNNVYINPTFTDSNDSSSSSEMNASDSKRTIFYDTRKGSAVTFKHFIEPTFTVENYQKPISSHVDSDPNYNSRLCVNISSLSLLDVSGSPVAGPIESHYATLFARIERKVLKEVRSKIVDSFTFGNFIQTIGLTIDALEWYYSLDSILSYDGDSAARDKNQALIIWQERFNHIDVYTRQNELRKLLETRCIPPKYFELIRWIFQNYRSANLEQAEAYRFVPHQSFLWFRTEGEESFLSQFNSRFDAILNKLRVPQYQDNKVNTILAMLDETYIINSLPLSSNNSVYDGQHHQIFVNQPVWYNETVGGSPTDKCYPDHSTEGTYPVMYCSNESLANANGLAFTLQDSYSSTQGKRVAMLRTFPAADFYAPYHDWDSNKYDVDYYNGIMGFYPRVNYNNYPNSIGDVHHVQLKDMTTTGIVTSKHSQIIHGYQQVFFNPTLSPLIDVRQLIDSLWGVF